MAVTELLRNDYDLNLHKVYNPSAPVDPTDIVRLQDLTGYAAWSAKFIIQQPNALLPNAQALSALATGLVKNTTTTGVLSIATGGTDYEFPLTFAQGVTRTVNNVVGDYITGKTGLGGGQTTWTGGVGSGEGIILRTTSHATKGRLSIGTSAYDENTNRLGVGTLTPLAPLHSEHASNFQLRLGQSAAADYDLGRNASDGLFYVHSNHTLTGGFVIDGGGSEKFRVAGNGNVTIPDLGGGSSALVKASTTGLLSRATAGTDYEVALTFSQGVTRASNVVTGDYITGKTGLGGGQTTWTGGVGSGEGIILRTTSHATKGKLTIGTSAYDEANNRLGIGTLSPTAQLHSEAAGNFQLRLGQSAGADYDLGRNSSDGLFYIHSNHGGSAGGLVIDGAGSERFRVAASGFVGINEPSPARLLDIHAASGDFQLRIGHGAGSNVNYDIGRSNTDGLLYFYGNQAVNGYVFTGANGVRMTIANAGTVTINDLGGSGSELVKASAAGLLSRATAGTDYQAIITLTAGAGLTGGGTTAANRTFDVVAGDATIVVNANDLVVGAINTANINNSQVTYAKIQNVSASNLLGRGAGAGAGVTQEINLGTGLVMTSTTLSVTGFEVPLTFTSGLTRVSNTVTGDYITGKTGNQTWLGSTDSSGTLEIKSTSNATKGAMTLTASKILISNAETTFSNPTLVLDNTSASGQMGIHFKANTTLRGGIRADFNGSMYYFTNGSNHNFYIGGDAGTGTTNFTLSSGKASITNSGIFAINSIEMQDEGSEVLGIRNGTNDMNLRVYRTWTSSTNFERGAFDWITNSNILTIGAQKGSGGGTMRNVQFVGDAFGFFADASAYGSDIYFSADVPGAKDKVYWTLGGTTITTSASRDYFTIAPWQTNVNSGVAATLWTTVNIKTQTFHGVSGSPSITTIAALNIESPTWDALSVTNTYGIRVTNCMSYFDNIGSPIFEFRYDSAGGDGSYYGRIPVKVNGLTKYMHILNA